MVLVDLTRENGLDVVINGGNVVEVQEASCSWLIISVLERSRREQGPRINFDFFIKVSLKPLPGIEHFSREKGN